MVKKQKRFHNFFAFSIKFYLVNKFEKWFLSILHKTIITLFVKRKSSQYNTFAIFFGKSMPFAKLRI